MAILSKPVGIVVAAAVGTVELFASGLENRVCSWSHRTALRAYNHKLNGLFRLAAPAANLQQNLSYWLQPEPGAATGVGHVGAARPARLATNRKHRFLHNRQLLQRGACAQAARPLARGGRGREGAVRAAAPDDQAGDKLGQVGPVSEVDIAGRGDRQRTSGDAIGEPRVDHIHNLSFSQ